MYLHIGQDYILNEEDILGIFDMDNTSSSYRTRAFLRRAEQEGRARKDQFVLTLPGMPQFRKVYCLDAARVLEAGENGRRFEDSIGLAGDWRQAGPVWEIPYRSLYPRVSVDGLLAAGRCTGARGDAWEVTRVIPVAALTGQARRLPQQ